MSDVDDRSLRGASEFQLHLRRPERSEKQAPCQVGCPGSGDVRSWIGIVAQRERTGLSEEEACDAAWRVIVERNPFPATIGRVCPHPCESACNRNAKDGPVSINAMERYLGDWGLARGLALPRAGEDRFAESIGVIGAGPAGLSFAYQMARRGYPVTVYDTHPSPGGMLTYGIPRYRLPKEIVAAEVTRIGRLGVRFELGVRVGDDVTIEELRERHALLFVGIGAQRSRKLGIPGEDGPGVLGGIEFLERVNRRRDVALGEHVVVIGGGNTAIDAARAARRRGVRVALVYRRGRAEMPAIPSEVDEALDEGVELTELAAPHELIREAGAPRALRLQRMRLGPPDEHGRPRPVPIEGKTFEIPCHTLIAAVSQEARWEGLREPAAAGREDRNDEDRTYEGGDVLAPGIASAAIGQGRAAAEHAHARLRGDAAPPRVERTPLGPESLHLGAYADAPRAEPRLRPPAARLADPEGEVTTGIRRNEFLAEVERCFSCGSCFGCERCAMYCNPCGYAARPEPRPGAYFDLSLAVCEGCGKCIELCPCGFIRLRPQDIA